MDVLYDDLENYNNVNALQELRKENVELKLKLEEHSAAMEKLKKDYDKLEHGFNTLQRNYSSLLITARDEVKRKTDEITKLNIDKDMMILNALQKGQNLLRRNKWGQGNKGSNQTTKTEKTEGNQQDANKNTCGNKKNDNHRKVDPKMERCDMAASSGTNRTSFTSKVDTSTTKMTTPGYHKNEEYQGSSQYSLEYNDSSKLSARSIQNRRKSMPTAEGMELEKYGYDGEYEARKSFKGGTRTQFDRLERRHLDKVSSDRHSNKTSETSSLDDRHPNYPESRDYRGRPSRYEADKHRGWDRYEVSQRHKHYSPERPHIKSQKEYREDNYRSEPGRYRVLESPPPYTFSRHSRHQDPKSNYNRYAQETETYRQNFEEKYPVKHKMITDYEEPHTKRPKLDTYDKTDNHFEVERNYNAGKVSMERFPGHVDLQDIDTRASCQSPDFSEVTNEHTVKEIRSTAAGQLEDPRKTSNKYILKTENGIETIATVTGRDIDIIKTTWETEKVNVPVALLNPPQTSEELINEIYMDIDNPVTNSSPESGKICDVETVDLVNTNGLINKVNCLETIEDTNIKYATELMPKDDLKLTHESNTKYKIPKIHKNNKTGSSVHIPTAVSNLPQTKSGEIKKSGTNKQGNVPSASLPQITSDCDDGSENITGHKKVSKKPTTTHQGLHEDENIGLCPSIGNKTIDVDNLENRTQTQASIALVEGDLELSDETSEFIDTTRKSSDKLDNTRKMKLPDEIKSKSLGKQKKIVTSRDIKPDHSKDSSEIKQLDMVERTDRLDRDKTQRSKKKKNRSKDMNSKGCIEESAVAKPDKKTKKDKDNKPKQVKSKFNDLFGDSSSLIMPEDLGIPVYGLVACEDAQNAVDINIREAQNQDPETIIQEQAIESDINIKKSEEEQIIEIAVTNKEVENVSQYLEKHAEKTSNEAESKNPSIIPEITNSNDILTNLVYEDLDANSKSDVVETVIISTGVQPQFAAEGNTDVVKTLRSDKVQAITTRIPIDYNQIPAIRNVKGQFSMSALATSTPYKEHTTIASNPVDVLCNSNNTQSESLDPGVTNQADTNIFSAQNDVPDVRIFVKRRRKGIKRPPIT